MFGRSAFDARLGSTLSADSNDPLFLDFVGAQYAYLPNVAGNYIGAADSAALSITGAIDLRLVAALDDWTPSAVQVFVGKYRTSDNNRSYRFYLNTDGTFVFQWSADGVTNALFTSSAAPAVADGGILAVRVTFDPNIGGTSKEARFYTKATTPGGAYADANSDTGWTQLGTTQQSALASAIFDGAASLFIGSYESGGTNSLQGKVYAAIVKAGINGTLALGADLTDKMAVAEPLASFVEKSLNAATLTITRSATGRKVCAVDRKVFLFGTDDYMEVPDNPLLNFGLNDSFTVLALVRAFGVPPATAGRVLSKMPATTGLGWRLYQDSAGAQYTFHIHDGTNSVFRTGPAESAGVRYGVVGVRDVAQDRLLSYLDGAVSGAQADGTTAALTNSSVLRIGVASDAVSLPFDGEFFGAAIFRKALSAAEIAQAITELKAA